MHAWLEEISEKIKVIETVDLPPLELTNEQRDEINARACIEDRSLRRNSIKTYPWVFEKYQKTRTEENQEKIRRRK